VLAYIVRRLLLMIPTFLGILVINFGVLRLQNPPFSDVQQQGGSAKGGEGLASERRAGGASKQYANLVDRYRRTGNDLPALVNLRGFTDKAEIVARLRKMSPTSGLKDSKRIAIERDLWLGGPLLVQPLYEVLADDALAELHAPASQAYALCAHTTLEPKDDVEDPARANAIRERDRILAENVIAYRQEPTGFVVTDPAAADKRKALLAVYESELGRADFARSRSQAWSAVLLDTGFVTFLGRLFTGRLVSETRPTEYVFDIIGRSWKVTFWLNTIATILAWVGSIPLGIRSARRAGSLEDRVTTNALFVLWSLPSFFIGAVLLHHFCTDTVVDGQLRAARFPNIGLSSPDSLWYTTPRYLLDLAWHGFLPLLVLSYASFTSLSRYMRGNLLDQLQSEYARTARAKGASEDRVVYRHALRNSLLTLITLGSGLLAELFGGVLIVELLFSIPGLGLLILDSAIQHDAALLMATTA
jgi:ABC-type dipeptide/oligopeptide/nickel transport system permease component